MDNSTNAYSVINKTRLDYFKMTKLQHNINSLQHMLHAIRHTCGPITVSYKDLSADVVFMEDGRDEMVDFLAELLYANKEELAHMTDRDKPTPRQITPKYRVLDEDGNLMVEENNE